MNYLAHAMPDLQGWCRLLHETSAPASFSSLQNLIDTLEISERFSLPKGGDLFETNYHGLEGLYPKLPYPRIILEYEDNFPYFTEGQKHTNPETQGIRY